MLLRIAVASHNPVEIGATRPLLTDGRYTRESICTQTRVIALTPLVNSLHLQR